MIVGQPTQELESYGNAARQPAARLRRPVSMGLMDLKFSQFPRDLLSNDDCYDDDDEEFSHSHSWLVRGRAKRPGLREVSGGQ